MRFVGKQQQAGLGDLLLGKLLPGLGVGAGELVAVGAGGQWQAGRFWRPGDLLPRRADTNTPPQAVQVLETCCRDVRMHHRHVRSGGEEPRSALAHHSSPHQPPLAFHHISSCSC